MRSKNEKESKNIAVDKKELVKVMLNESEGKAEKEESRRENEKMKGN